MAHGGTAGRGTPSTGSNGRPAKEGLPEDAAPAATDMDVSHRRHYPVDSATWLCRYSAARASDRGATGGASGDTWLSSRIRPRRELRSHRPGTSGRC
jgi:hypothetical protein